MTSCLHIWKHPRTLVVVCERKLLTSLATRGHLEYKVCEQSPLWRACEAHLVPQSRGAWRLCLSWPWKKLCVDQKGPRLYFLVLLFHSDKRHIAQAYCLGHFYLTATSAATIVHAQNSPMVSQGKSKHYHYFLLQGGHHFSPFCPWTELSCAPMSTTYSSFCVQFISFIKRY